MDLVIKQKTVLLSIFQQENEELFHLVFSIASYLSRKGSELNCSYDVRVLNHKNYTFSLCTIPFVLKEREKEKEEV